MKDYQTIMEIILRHVIIHRKFNIKSCTRSNFISSKGLISIKILTATVQYAPHTCTYILRLRIHIYKRKGKKSIFQFFQRVPYVYYCYTPVFPKLKYSCDAFFFQNRFHLAPHNMQLITHTNDTVGRTYYGCQVVACLAGTLLKVTLYTHIHTHTIVMYIYTHTHTLK